MALGAEGVVGGNTFEEGASGNRLSPVWNYWIRLQSEDHFQNLTLSAGVLRFSFSGPSRSFRRLSASRLLSRVSRSEVRRVLSSRWLSFRELRLELLSGW